MSTDPTAARFACWKEEKILDELVQADLLLSEIASASSVDFDERVVQQYIEQHGLKPIPWVKDDDNVIKNLWKENKTIKEICQQLVVHRRSEIAVCIRVSQLKLKWSNHQRNHSPVDGYTYMVGERGGWTATGDAYVLRGFDDGLSDWEIWYRCFRNTRTDTAVSKRRRALVKQRASASIDPNASTSGTPTQPLPILQPDQSPQISSSALEVCEQMMIFYTNLSTEHRDCILNLINRLSWPASAQGDGETEIGCWSGPEFAWSDADNELLVALHSEYGLNWKEIANTFFVDRLEQELQVQYEMLVQGGDTKNSIALD